ncbi:MAG: alginate export family protein [Phycisphaerae bacterium]|nr:alginate export family protein [Phycisphaerae bacterium]
MHNRHLFYLLIAFVLVGLITVPAVAQEDLGLRIYAEELRTVLDRQEAAMSGFDAGGWFNFAFINYDDPAAGKVRTLRQYELRGWASMNLQGGAHKAYFRGLLRYNDWNSGDNPTANRGDDFDTVIERAWYELNLAKLLDSSTNGAKPRFNLRLKVGRDYTTIGTALVLALPLDQIKFTVDADDWEFIALLGKTIKGSDNIDASELITHQQDRCFYAFQVSYNGFQNHRPFVYFMGNNDHSKPYTHDATQSYDYSSKYLGIGSEGTLLVKNLSYKAEVVGEWGKTYSAGSTTTQDKICAIAADVQLEYLFDARTNPRIMFEYLFGSGDSDRTQSSSSTVGGNTAGTTDYAFNAFGYRDTGISLAPRISNIHIFTLGFRFFPLEHIEMFREFELGSKVFYYQKANSGGAISDPLATRSGPIGFEWDIYFNWRITSDLAWSTRYGVFFPGGAYSGSDDECRHFLYSGLVFSF